MTAPDYARELHDARQADAHLYPEPGQWVGGEWHEPDYEDMR